MENTCDSCLAKQKTIEELDAIGIAKAIQIESLRAEVEALKRIDDAGIITNQNQHSEIDKLKAQLSRLKGIENALYSVCDKPHQDFSWGEAYKALGWTEEKYATKNPVRERDEEISRLKEVLKKKDWAIKSALTSIKQHDDAPFQCESVEGAQGAMNCRETLEEALLAEGEGEK